MCGMTDTKLASASPWRRHARQWSHVGSPLRPCEEDSELYWRAVSDHVGGLAAPRALILGVTPELAQLPWPSAGHLTAIDRSPDMIARVWPADDLPCPGEAQCAHWHETGLPDASIDVILGDGALSALPSGKAYAGVIAELHRVLRPGGRFALRSFCRPDEQEPIDRVFASLEAGAIGSMHALKWRIAMALQPSLDDGMMVSAIRDCFNDHLPDRAAAAERFGWPIEEVDTIDAYTDSKMTLTFPTLGEITEAVAGRFAVRHVAHPSYELGERCPVIGFERMP